MRKRIAGITVLILATAAVAVIAYEVNIAAPVTNVIGAFAAIAAWIAVCAFIKVDDGFYFSVLIFIFLASPLGSVLNLYRTVDSYDKIVHFISGFLLAYFGMIIIELLMNRAADRHGYGEEHVKVFIFPMIFASYMFSSGAAGIWEIFEFIADKLAGGEMQRGMVDTVTDIIAGNLGALLYGTVMSLKSRKKDRKTTES